MATMKIKEQPHLVKDVASGAVININKDEILSAKKRKAARMAEKERINNLEHEVEEMREIIKMLIRETK